MKRSFKTMLLAAASAMLGLLLYFILPVNLSSIRPGIALKQAFLDSLMSLQEQAAQLGEYPVSALIVYKDSIIGTGINSVRNLNDPLGHAEINALREVFKTVPYSEFRGLSRDSLCLITSYEPCPMCQGAINHLDIRKIYYLKAKSLRYRLKYRRLDLSYSWKIRRIKTKEDQ